MHVKQSDDTERACIHVGWLYGEYMVVICGRTLEEMSVERVHARVWRLLSPRGHTRDVQALRRHEDRRTRRAVTTQVNAKELS